MHSIRWIEEGGTQVLLVDLSYSSAARATSLIDEAGHLIREAPPESVSVLVDFTGVKFTPDLVALIKKITTLDRGHVRSSAWVGSDNLSAISLASIERVSQRTFRQFQTRDEALKFLTSEAASNEA